MNEAKISYHVTKIISTDGSAKYRPWVMVSDDLECIEAITSDPWSSYDVALDSAKYRAASVANIVFRLGGKMIKPIHKDDNTIDLRKLVDA